MKKASSPSSHLGMILALNFLAIALAVTRAILRQKIPMRYFEETGIMTWMSCLQLLILAGLSWRIRYFRQQVTPGPINWKSPARLWTIMTLGFVFLAIDEIVQIHENTDRLIHWFFGITENRLTDSIDDIIVLFYSFIGGYILYCFWHEFKRYRPAFRFLIAAFILKAIMVMFDLYTNDETLVFNWVTNPQYQELVYDGLRTVEESLKLIAEGVFIAAFCVCLNLARQMSLLAQLRE